MNDYLDNVMDKYIAEDSFLRDTVGIQKEVATLKTELETIFRDTYVPLHFGIKLMLKTFNLMKTTLC